MLETRLTIQGNRLNDHDEAHQLGGDHRDPDRGDGLLRPDVPYLGFQQVGGFVSSIVLIFTLGISLYLLFKRKGWL